MATGRSCHLLIPRLQQEVTRFIREIGAAPTLAAIPPEELMNTFDEVRRELRDNPISGLFGTTVNLHKKRIGEALASRKFGRTHSIVIYLPTVPSRSFGRDTQVRKTPGFKIMDMPAEISFGGRGGRLWGIGFAEHRRDRTYRNSSYQLFRVDYHGARHRDHLHREPYAKFFRMDDDARNHEFHWQIPTSPKDARGGRNSE